MKNGNTYFLSLQTDVFNLSWKIINRLQRDFVSLLCLKTRGQGKNKMMHVMMLLNPGLMLSIKME